MSSFDEEKVRKYLAEYLATLEDIGASMKEVRKYLEKKLQVPRKSLNEKKAEIKTLLKEEAQKVMKARQAAEKKEKEQKEKETKKEKTSKKAKTTKKVEAPKEEKEAPKEEEEAPKEEEEAPKEEEMEETGSEEDSDPEPKRYLTSYILFSNAKRTELKEKYPEMSITELTTKISELWKNLSEKEKQPYVDESAKAKKEYDEAFSAWRERNPTKQTRREMKLEKKRCNETKVKIVKGRKAYRIFCDEKSKELTDIEDKSELRKKLSEMWKALGSEEKAVYVEKESEELKQYAANVAAEEEKQKEKEMKEEKKRIRALTPHARSAYLFFCEMKREEVKKANPEAEPKEIMRLLAAEWKKADKKTISQCQKKADEDKEAVQKQIEDLRKDGTLPEKIETPKRMSGYNVFMKDFCATYRKKHPETSLKDCAATASKEWKSLSDKKKEKFIKTAAEHNKQLPESPKKTTVITASTAKGWYMKEYRAELLEKHPKMPKDKLKDALTQGWEKLSLEEKIEYENKVHEYNIEKLRKEYN